MTGPLNDVRVVELGHALAGPFSAVLLADFGADVIKVEPPGQGDSLRDMGPKIEHSSIWWSVTGRNKRSVAINFKSVGGQRLIRGLVASADVVVENFRPGVLERVGLGWEQLNAVNPDLIMLRVSGFGQTGPYSSRGGFGKIAEAFSGATNLTGNPEDIPFHPSYSLGDTTAGLMGAFGIVMALHERDRSGKGQMIDLPLYEPLFRMIEWQVPLYQRTGEVAKRSGHSFPFDGAFVTDICATKDGSRIVVSAATSESLKRLCSLLTREGRFHESDEVTSNVELVEALRAWALRNTREDALRKLEAERLVAGPLYTAADLVNDPHVAARGNIASIPTDDGEVLMPNVVPCLTRTPGKINWAGARLGEHTDEVLSEILGLPKSEITELRNRGLIA